MKKALIPKSKDTTLTITSVKRLQDLVLLLRAFDNSTVDFPIKVGWSSTKRAWFARTGQHLWYCINGRLQEGK